MTDAIFEITDGTTTISLINKSSGFHLASWTPGIMDYKGGGVFQNPPLADYRQLRVGKWATVEENMSLHVDAANPNGSAYALQELRRLLQKANDYWTTDWQNTPVYLTAKANCETNTRYCLIVKGRLGNDRNYFQQPFTGKKSTMQDLPLVIEHRAWLENPPGTGTAIELSAVESYNGVNYGNVNSSEVRTPTTGKVYLAAKRNEANITNIHLTTAGANRIGASPPYDIINATGETYFGIDTSVADSGPFSNLVFDIGTAKVGGNLTWEYWNGAWTSLTVLDKTSSFTNLGVNIVSWAQPADWATTAPGALPTGYWVRVRVSSGTMTTEPQQQNRNVYSVIWPYTEVQSSAIGGDIPALNRILLYGDGSLNAFGNNWFVLGLRSVSRGENFTAYLNAADEQNPTDVSLALGANTAYINLLNTATGRAVQFSPPSDTTNYTDVIQFLIDNPLSEEYFGAFHAYLRFATNVVGTWGFNARIGLSLDATDQLRTNSSPVAVSGTGSENGLIADLGNVYIQPHKVFSSEEMGLISIYISIAPTDIGGDTIDIYDLILIPVDEWAGEFSSPVSDSGIVDGGNDRYLDIDSIHSKKPLNAMWRDGQNNDERLTIYRHVANGPVILQANSRQRLWLLSRALVDDESKIESAFAIEFSANARYFAQRGER